MKPFDSECDDSIPLMISNHKLLDCCYCFQPLTIPVFQCDNGHIVCSTCYPKHENKCRKCSSRIGLRRCKAIENLLRSIKMPCPNAKHGCREKIRYIGNRKHEEECIHEPCYCPSPGCDLVASSEILSNHFGEKHGDSLIKFLYGLPIFVSVKYNDEVIVLQEENDGKLFILNNSTMISRNAVNICCIGPTSSKAEYSYNILAGSPKCKLKLQSFAKNVQRHTLATLLSEFLLISFDSSETLKLEICINYYYDYSMEIYIKTLYGAMIPLRVKSLDMIVNVKKKVLDKEGIPVHEQRLIFDGYLLEDNQTLANYKIQDNSTLHLIIRMSGS